jgi:hypothetical protein
MSRFAALALAATLAACSRPQETAQAPAQPSPPPPLKPLDPPGPGEPGGLPDDRTPVSEAPFTPESAQGAANVVQTYYALVEAGKFAEARRLRSDGGGDEADFDRYSEYHANIGAPGRIEGAAGSLYVEVPVQAYGRLKSGEPFNLRGSATLRRVNDVPGATPEQLRWRIASIDLEPTP